MSSNNVRFYVDEYGTKHILDGITEEDQRLSEIINKSRIASKFARERDDRKMKKKYQVFISSTYTDLKEERSAVMQCLLDINCIPVGMEQFPASNMKQMDYIIKMLDDCDYYILILAGRYGSLDAEDGIGYTEKEYDYAKKKGIPVMSFLVDDLGRLPTGVCEQEDVGKKRLNAFREKVCSDKMVKFYSNTDDLRVKVISSIYHCIEDSPAVGWVRSNDTLPPEDLETKFEEFLAKHTATEEDVHRIWNEVFSDNSMR